jgi:hypothetical protein
MSPRATSHAEHCAAFPLEHTASFRPLTPVGWASAPVSPHFEAVDELGPACGPSANNPNPIIDHPLYLKTPKKPTHVCLNLQATSALSRGTDQTRFSLQYLRPVSTLQHHATPFGRKPFRVASLTLDEIVLGRASSEPQRWSAVHQTRFSWSIRVPFVPFFGFSFPIDPSVSAACPSSSEHAGWAEL